ncbi:MAG TPA: hypothetical protein PK261_08990, partial [Accumulibacter sp.]|nr:hypothetical protein [Accumulibacter sp.]
RALPALPIALRDVHASVNGSNVYVHGLEAGAKPQLYALALKDAVPTWRALPGCDAAGVVEHLVAHEDAVYAVVAPADGSGELHDIIAQIHSAGRASTSNNSSHSQPVLRRAGEGAGWGEVVAMIEISPKSR